MLKSCIKSGIAGSTIVSPYIVIRPKQLRIASVAQADRLMLVCSSTPVISSCTPSIFCDYLRIPEVGNMLTKALAIRKLDASPM
jgi:hypothetical protein